MFSKLILFHIMSKTKTISIHVIKQKITFISLSLEQVSLTSYGQPK